MSAVHVLRGMRRGVAPLAVCACVAAAPAAAFVDSGPPRPSASPGIVLAQAGGAPVSPYQEPAPELFEATGTAVWDGKRTLQGVWVAHPEAPSARRVRIYNTETGAAVDGALFKRDPALSGPAVLVSSEAAQFLGMSPGDKVDLRIVALTPSQRPATEPAAGEEAAGAAAAPPEPAAQASASAEAAGTAAGEAGEPMAATADAAARPVSRIPAPRPERPAGAAAAASAQDEDQAVPAAAPPRARMTATQRAPKESHTVRPLFLTPPSAEESSEAPAGASSGKSSERKVQSPATVAAVMIAEPTPEEAAPAPSRPDFQAPPPSPSPESLTVAPARAPAAPVAEASPETTGAPEIDAPETVAALNAVVSEPALITDAPSAAPRVAPPAAAMGNDPALEASLADVPDPVPSADTPAAALTAPAPEPAPARSAADSTLSHPYVQAGIFGVAENADRLIGKLKAADLPALGKPIQLNGKPATRVLAGPFTAMADRDAALRTIRDMGLRDAAPVTR